MSLLSSQANQPHFLVSHPRCGDACADRGNDCLFQVAWSINPHMQVGAVQTDYALWQHATFVRALERAGARVTLVPFVHGAFDSVFSKDNAVVVERCDGRVEALLARPRHAERVLEQEHRASSYAALGVRTRRAASYLEGGDVVMLPDGSAFVGFGFRSSSRAASDLERFLDRPVTCLELRDPRLYHLDMALTVLADGTALVCLEALTDDAVRSLREHPAITSVLPVPLEEALGFGVNLVQIHDTIVWGAEAKQTTAALVARGYDVRRVPLGQFHLAGGSAACLVARVHAPVVAEELAPESTAA